MLTLVASCAQYPSQPESYVGVLPSGEVVVVYAGFMSEGRFNLIRLCDEGQTDVVPETGAEDVRLVANDELFRGAQQGELWATRVLDDQQTFISKFRSICEINEGRYYIAVGTNSNSGRSLTWNAVLTENLRTDMEKRICAAIDKFR